MPHSPEQAATLAAQAAFEGGTPDHFKGFILKRDGRFVPADDPSERHRAADADVLNVETDDDPADVVVVEKNEKNEDVEKSREKRPNDSALDAHATVA